MVLQAADWFWLDAHHRLDRAQLARISQLTPEELDQLVDHGALVPVPGEGAQPQFSASCVPPLREAVRLRTDHHLDLFTVGLLLRYLQRIVQLEQQVRSLQAHGAHAPQLLPREGPAPWREPHA